MTKELSRLRQLATEKAAQIWCEPKHSQKEMDSEFAESIVKALLSFGREVLDEAKTSVTNTFPKIHTWASENSDRYHIQDEAISLAAERIDALRAGLEEGQGEKP